MVVMVRAALRSKTAYVFVLALMGALAGCAIIVAANPNTGYFAPICCCGAGFKVSGNA